jgi:hypothetical protein
VGVTTMSWARIHVAFALLGSAAGTLEHIQVSRGSTALQKQVILVEKLVSDFQAAGGVASAVERDAFSDVKETLEGTFLPHIQDGHDADQKALNDAADGIAKCNSDFAVVRAEVVGKQNAADAARGVLGTCTTEQATLQGKSDSATGIFTTFADSLRAAEPEQPGDSKGPDALLQGSTGLARRADTPKCALPSGATSSSDIEQFFANSIAFFDDKKSTGAALNDAMAQAAKDLADKVAECATKKTAYEVAYCTYRAQIPDAQSGFATCRKDSTEFFEAVKAKVVVTMGYRKTDYAAVKHLLCFMDVIMSADAAAGDKLTVCQGMTVDTTHLNLVIPTPVDAASSEFPEAEDTNVQCE